MKNLIKKVIGYILLQTRDLFNFFINFKEVSILCYHGIDESGESTSVSPDEFTRQMSYLVRKHYYFATLNEIVDYIDGKIDLPQKTAALTFDDGYESFLIRVLPILRSLNIPAALFIITDFENGGYLGQKAALLSAKNLKELLNFNLVSLQFHSKTHPNLVKLDEESLKKEIIDGKIELENKLGIKLDYFAYPGGGYNKDVVNLVQEAGFKAAFSVKRGLIHRNAYKFLIRRNVILGKMSFWEFKLRLTKAIDWYRKLSFKFKY